MPLSGVAFLFVQNIYTLHHAFFIDTGVMKGNERTSAGETVVTFSIEFREATSMQIEAGKRLFNSLVTRARSKGEKCQNQPTAR